MPKTPIAEYIDKMRWRHKDGTRVLAMSKMSTEAGLSINTVQQIIAGDVRPTPDTLMMLAMKWGDISDYYKMMELAGYQVSEEGEALKHQEVLESLRGFSEEELLTIANAAIQRVREQRAKYDKG